MTGARQVFREETSKGSDHFSQTYSQSTLSLPYSSILSTTYLSRPAGLEFQSSLVNSTASFGKQVVVVGYEVLEGQERCTDLGTRDMDNRSINTALDDVTAIFDGI
eukprot:scaffold11837_cov76-Amphora_coffeaeformis.AAC.1